MMPDTFPLLKAVNSPEPKVGIPLNRKDSVKIERPSTVICIRASSPWENALASGADSASIITVATALKTNTTVILFVYRFFRLSLLPAP